MSSVTITITDDGDTVDCNLSFDPPLPSKSQFPGEEEWIKSLSPSQALGLSFLVETMGDSDPKIEVTS